LVGRKLAVGVQLAPNVPQFSPFCIEPAPRSYEAYFLITVPSVFGCCVRVQPFRFSPRLPFHSSAYLLRRLLQGGHRVCPTAADPSLVLSSFDLFGFVTSSVPCTISMRAGLGLFLFLLYSPGIYIGFFFRSLFLLSRLLLSCLLV
jgi:hypothetical protein